MDKNLVALANSDMTKINDDMMKVEAAVEKAVIALKASVDQVIPSETISRFKFYMRCILSAEEEFLKGKSEDEQFTDLVETVVRQQMSSDLEQAVDFINGLVATLTATELSNFFKNLLKLEEPIHKKEEIPGRYSVEQPIEWTLGHEVDQDSFWGQAFLTMLLRLHITTDAFKDRLEEELVVNARNDDIQRWSKHSEIMKVFIDKKMSYSNYLFCAKLLGFTHVKVELI